MDTQVEDEIQESLDLIKKTETPAPVAVDNTPLIDELKRKIKLGYDMHKVYIAKFSESLDDVTVVHGIPSLDMMQRQVDEIKQSVQSNLIPITNWSELILANKATWILLS